MLWMSVYMCVDLTADDQVHILFGICVFVTLVSECTHQEEVTRLCLLSDFLLPSPVTHKLPNLSRVHLSRLLRWDLNSLDASAEERCLFLDE